MSLSDRLRPNIEAAPWVIEEIKELEKAYQEQEEELDATMMTFNILKKENEQLKIAFNSIKFALTEIAIHAEGTLTILNDIEDN